MSTRLLVISNGHGEDTMGVLLGRALRGRGLAVSAFPLVGEGRAYVSAGLPVVGVQAAMPSGGFVLEGIHGLWQDVRAGLLKLTWRQTQAMRQLSSESDWAVGVGDIYPLLMNALFLRRPFLFVPTAKSDYIRGHFGWEVALMRAHCRAVFPRDSRTAAALAAQGAPAEYLGNLMMDALHITGYDFGVGDRPIVALLPGSREPEAYRNTRLMLRTVQSLCNDPDMVGARAPVFLLALAGGLSETELAAVVGQGGWGWQSETAGGGSLISGDGGCRVNVVRGRFGDVVAQACVVLGMSGTGNEQAAGLGVPVVAPIGPGPQFTRRFALDQQRLLGEAVWVVEQGAEAAAAVRTLLLDEQRRRRMGRVGEERMGVPGATLRMVERMLAVMSSETVGGEV
jgi:uncharacterized protein (TIGR03492 family)